MTKSVTANTRLFPTDQFYDSISYAVIRELDQADDCAAIGLFLDITIAGQQDKIYLTHLKDFLDNASTTRLLDLVKPYGEYSIDSEFKARVDAIHSALATVKSSETPIVNTVTKLNRAQLTVV